MSLCVCICLGLYKCQACTRSIESLCLGVHSLLSCMQYNWLAVGKLCMHCLHAHARGLWSFHHFSGVQLPSNYVALASLSNLARMQISCFSFGLLLPVLLLVLLRCHEVWVTIASPGERMAIQTQNLTLPFLLLPAPARASKTKSAQECHAEYTCVNKYVSQVC